MAMMKARTRKPIAARRTTPAAVRRTIAPVAGAQVCLGRLVGWDDRGPLVAFEGGPREPVRARLTTTGAQLRPKLPLAPGHEVVLLVDPRPRQPPVLLGFLQPLHPSEGPSDLEARVDGRRVELEGHDEVVLRCGEASITLRRNGRVVINGVQVETRARGVNRIKGGSVAIN
jgi:hypothetical protein